MRRYVQPGDPDFDEVFDIAAPYAEKVEPVDVAPRAWYDRLSLPPHLRFRRSMLGDQYQSQLRINDDDGRFLGVLFLYRSTMPESLVQRLGRGDARLFERMDRVSDPARRSAAILFADLEASGDLSRRLSSRAYFELIRDLTDLIDSVRRRPRRHRRQARRRRRLGALPHRRLRRLGVRRRARRRRGRPRDPRRLRRPRSRTTSRSSSTSASTGAPRSWSARSPPAGASRSPRSATR